MCVVIQTGFGKPIQTNQFENGFSVNTAIYTSIDTNDQSSKQITAAVNTTLHHINLTVLTGISLVDTMIDKNSHFAVTGAKQC